jgi:hypothetical protein
VTWLEPDDEVNLLEFAKPEGPRAMLRKVDARAKRCSHCTRERRQRPNVFGPGRPDVNITDSRERTHQQRLGERASGAISRAHEDDLEPSWLHRSRTFHDPVLPFD